MGGAGGRRERWGQGMTGGWRYEARLDSGGRTPAAAAAANVMSAIGLGVACCIGGWRALLKLLRAVHLVLPQLLHSGWAYGYGSAQGGQRMGRCAISSGEQAAQSTGARASGDEKPS